VTGTTGTGGGTAAGTPRPADPARPVTPVARPKPRTIEFDDDELDVPDFLK
jgi:hypothetical protein